MVMDSLYSIRDNCDISIMLGRWYILWTSEDINLEILWVLFKGKYLQIWFFPSRGNQCKHFCTKKRLLLLFSYIRYNLFFLLFREKKVWRMLVTIAVLTREERILRIYFSILTSLQILSWQGVKRLFFLPVIIVLCLVFRRCFVFIRSILPTSPGDSCWPRTCEESEFVSERHCASEVYSRSLHTWSFTHGWANFNWGTPCAWN